MIMDVSSIVEIVHRRGIGSLGLPLRPIAFCVVGASDLAVMSWEHAGAIPPRWDFGGTLASWSEGVRGQVNEPAAKAFLEG